MESPRHRPRVSRETRLLLATVCVAAVALWVLARVRSLEPGATPITSPPPALLAPLVRAPHDQLNADLARIDARIGPWLSAVAVDAPARPGGGSVPAVRVREDLVLAIVPPGADARPEPGTVVVGTDRPTGLTLVRRIGAPPPPALSTWSAPPPRSAVYLMAAEATPAGVALRPLLVRGVSSKVVRGWREPLWALPAAPAVAAGTAVFTIDAEFVGIVVEDQGVLALAPGPTILAEVDRLLARGNRPSGELAVEVEPLTQGVAALLGVKSGVVVTWVDSTGPAKAVIELGDVVQEIDGESISSADDWLLHAARILAGDEVRLRIVRGGESREVRVVAASAAGAPPVPRQTSAGQVRSRATLGLDMRTETGQGIAVRGVTPGSRAEEAGLRVGDIITRAGGVIAPTPAQLRQAFASGPVMLVVTRGARHHVLALQP